MREAVMMAVIVLLAGRPAFAQNDPPTWEVAAAVYTYMLPDEGNYAQPTVAVDRDWLHVEARYNYEERRTGSIWAGYNFDGGEAVQWSLTPMLGDVFGDLAGVAPGYAGSLTWRMLDFYSEGEWVLAARASSDSFLYNWSEFAIAPTHWFRFGMVTQRTHVYETERAIQRGVFVGAAFKSVEASTYVFNPDDSSPIVVISFGWSFSPR
jgi:hypothetical protein